MRTTVATLIVACVTLIGGSVARAAPTEVNVRIEGNTRTLFEGPILTEGHDVRSFKADGGNEAEDIAEHPCDGINPHDPDNVSPGPTPTAASVDAMNLIGETDALAGEWYPGYDDYFVKQWGSEEENAEHEGKSWGILVNNVLTDVGGCQYELHTADEVLWIYNASKSRPILGLFAANEDYTSGVRPLTATAQLGEPFAVEVAAYDGHGEGKPPATPERTSANTKPYEGAEVSPVLTSEKGFETLQTASPETVMTNSEGKASITFTTPGWHRIMAGTPLRPQTEEEEENGAIPEEAAIRSNRLDVCVPAAGETGCDPPPAEDQTRALPQYLEPTKEEHHEEEAKLHAEETKRHEEEAQLHEEEAKLHEAEAKRREEEAESSPEPEGKSDVPPSTPGVISPAPLLSAPAPAATNPVGQVALESITTKRLFLKLTAPGMVTVQISHQVGSAGDRGWRTVKTILIKVDKAGQIEVKLPRLSPGRYRVSIGLTGGTSVVKTLTVPRTRR